MRAPAVQVTEPGRSALTLLITEQLDVGRDCSGLILLDAAISRRHLSLTPGGASVLVADLGSLNGTTVDGRPVVEPHRLARGEVVRFGGCTLTLATSADAEAAPNSAMVAATLAGMVDRDGDVAALRATSIGMVADAVLDAALELGSTASRPSDAGTVTIVFSDIEGSTKRAVELGDLRWHEVLTVHNQIMRRMLARHHGTETHSLGDGFMMCFRSARSAISFAIDAQRALAAYESANPLAGLSVRVGIHTGEAVQGDDGDLFGRHVVMASRVADQAGGGEVLVSSLVREIVEPRGDIVFGESRTATLKGLAGEHLLHRIVW
jgi:class 3 adenylate cyclase